MGNCIERKGNAKQPYESSRGMPPGLHPDLISEKYEDLRARGSYAIQNDTAEDLISSIMANYKLLTKVSTTQNIKEASYPTIEDE